MRSVSDLTAAAVIRDTAMRLFAERGTAGVTVRDIAAAAGVSPALVIHHYKSKDGLATAVRDHALQAISELAVEFAATRPALHDVGSMAQAFAERMAAQPALLSYLRRLLVDGGEPAQVLFAHLYRLCERSLAEHEAAGLVRPSADNSVRVAFLLVNDLAVIVLREQIAAALGEDPLSANGIARWTRELLDVYEHGIYRPGEESGP